ncbi:hypothetical protein N0V93_005867 [Gnomoniopsis smithogilvyi]|uniref:Utp8 beta-propeller domain-containing protein n=1 Tax=Gnomoniopsis smithogilvyi TaxID=1191159 RepID=A0A9W8YTL1_9PEZI|nr:hypothetical protein N0V93_005867 [Gnomoniopsis smithogilvyi]
MAATFNIQRPYVLTTLPRPLNREGNGSAYAVGDVWGQQKGSKKRKRPELAVGIDGEAVNLYDVPSQRLITSYPIPPQSVFTCPPSSTRWRVAKSRDAARYTYISTRDPKPEITLFKDVLGASGDTTSTTVSAKVDHTSKIVHLSTAAPPGTDDVDATKSDLIAVAEDGSIMCFQGEDLRKRWETSPEILRQDLAAVPKASRLQVELVQAAPASDVVAGFFGGKQDAFAAFLPTGQEDASTQDMLILITKTTGKGADARHVHILGVSSSNATGSGRLVQIHTSPIPTSASASNRPGNLRLDVTTGSLMELEQDILVTYDLTTTMVKVGSTLKVPGVESFIRLSRTSVLASSADSLDVYNPVFQSLQASAAIGLESNALSESTLTMVAYFARLEIAVAIYGTSLVAVQLEAPRSRGKKRRSEGLLIDSIGRGIPHHRDNKKLRTEEIGSPATSFSSNLPGSVSGGYWTEFTADVQRADALLAANDLAAFEELMAQKFAIETKPADTTNGKPDADADADADQEQSKLPEWILPATRSEYPYADRRWVLFAITRVFAWQDAPESGEEETRLSCKLPQSNLLNMLIDAGHLTLSNLKSAFKDEIRGIDDIDHILGGDLPRVLVQVDPVFELLLSYLSSTKLGAVELLTAIRLIMRSLELVQDPTKIAPKLLTFESQASDVVDADDSALADQSIIGHELDRLNQELEAAEYFHLGDQSLIRGRGLSVAFGKLSSCPRVSTIRVLRRSYKPEEILSLIYVLRMELVKDGWTTRYLDTTQLDKDDELEAPPDGSISLIADLLCRCIDAVGPGGWLINDAIVAAGAGDHMDSADFLASLKLEISAALEGVQEAVFLRGIISEAVRYGNSVQKAEAEAGQKHKKRGDGAPQALVLRSVTPNHEVGKTGEAAMLPLGMKANDRVSAEKVISGGEVARRRKREVGHLVSQKGRRVLAGED